MCAYKLCKVEFHYWGMQTKIEKFIHDIALRKTMVRAHRQAWAWQDEWFGMSMSDIRELERETQETLRKKMAQQLGYDEEEEEVSETAGQTKGKPIIIREYHDEEETPRKERSSVSIKVSEEKEKEKAEANKKAAGAFQLVESLMKKESESEGSEDEFFDCLGEGSLTISFDGHSLMYDIFLFLQTGTMRFL